jgi:hypothetical protein
MICVGEGQRTLPMGAVGYVNKNIVDSIIVCGVYFARVSSSSSHTRFFFTLEPWSDLSVSNANTRVMCFN